MSSIRLAGIYNILISGAVAVLSYIALMIIAEKFGGNIGSDAYFFLLSLTTLGSGLITALFGVVMVPTFVDVMTKEGRGKANEFAGSIFGLTLIFLLPVAVAISSYHREFFLLVTKYSSADLNKIDFILVYFVPIFIATVLAEFFRFLALALSRYTLAAFGALFQPVFIILLVIYAADEMHEEVLPIALLVAKITVLVMCLWVLLMHDRLNIRPYLVRKIHLSRFLGISAPYFTANVVTNFAGFTFDYLATGLSAGVLSSIAFAQRIVLLPITVFINPLMEIARTRFAHARSSGDLTSLGRQHNQLLQIILYFTLPVSTFLYLFSDVVITVMFGRGAFSAESVTIASACLSVFAIAIPFSAIFYLNGRVVESFQRLTWPSLIGSIAHLFLIAITFYFVERFGYIGIPTAKTFVELLIFFPFGVLAMKLFLGFYPRDHLLKVIMSSSIASLAAAISCEVILQFYRDALSNVILESMILFIIFVATYSLFVLILDRRIFSFISDAALRFRVNA